MKINIIPNDQETRVCLIGDQVLALADKALEIDCEELEYISSAGLRFFMQLKRESESKGGSIRITHLNEDVNDIFRMSGFQNLFTIE